MTLSGALLDRLLLRATVREVTQVAPRLRQLRLSGPTLRGLPHLPGQHIQLFFSPAGLVPALRDGHRDYSIYDTDPTTGDLTLRIYDHGRPGPGAHFAATAGPGTEVRLTRPEGHLVARSGAPGWHLLVGDETGSVALGAIARAIPPTEEIFTVIEVDGPDHHIPLPRPESVTWAYRNTGPLVDAVRNLPLPDQPGTAYLAGESRSGQAIRRHLRQDLHWPRENVLLHGFWTANRSTVDAR